MEEPNRLTFESLVGWISDTSCGHVHASLTLRGSGPTRGLFATAPIRKGESLVVVPESLVLSGESLPSTYCSDRKASPWLRTVGAFYLAKREEKEFHPYLDSLPIGFDTMLEWSNHELESYLAGTTIGALAMKDREQKSLETRFKSAVRPYLTNLGVIGAMPTRSDEVELSDFRYACMCVSTRGFHLQQEANQEGLYHGPFLLPFIDLLNHDLVQQCTKLQRDPNTKAFFMIAERNISTDEEIFHSYGPNLTSSEGLQTFGFVPKQSIESACNFGESMAQEFISYVSISKSEVIEACKTLARSTFAITLANDMECNGMSDDEVWDLDIDEQVTRDFSYIPDDLIVNLSEPLSDELITLCCLIFFPSDAYQEFCKGVHPSLINRTILDDYFLGKLICQALLIVVRRRFGLYIPVSVPGIDNSVCGNDRKLLHHILEKSLNIPRALYGLTIRLEEKACLHALRAEVLGIMEVLDENTKAKPSVHASSDPDLPFEGETKMESSGKHPKSMIGE